jgi:leucyl aminopeptidase (aminopeptidase T)
VRIATMPGVTQEMLERAMSADYAVVKRRSEQVARVLTEGREVRVTSPQGTDLVLSIEGRESLADTGDLSSAGAFGNLPAGEGFIAPVEGTATGRVVFDGAVPRSGEPLVVTIEAGYATELGGDAGRRLAAEIGTHGREAFAVAELGIGTNDCARITGAVLEDEKVLGTVHVAFGDNHTFGGIVRVSSHVDHVVLEPTLRVDGTVVVTGGRLVL